MIITAETKEMIVQSYSKTFDKNMAYSKVGLSKSEQAELDTDPELQERLNLLLIQEREDIISKFRVFMDSEDDKIAFSATVKIAEVLYPDFFTAKNKGVVNSNELEEPLTREEAKRLLEEYGLVVKSVGSSKGTGKKV